MPNSERGGVSERMGKGEFRRKARGSEIPGQDAWGGQEDNSALRQSPGSVWVSESCVSEGTHMAPECMSGCRQWGDAGVFVVCVAPCGCSRVHL